MPIPASRAFPRRRPSCGRLGAFTLLELMLAICVLSIMVALLFGILNQVSSTWTQIRAQIDRHQTGRSILNSIASELRIAALPGDRSNNQSLQLVVDPVALLPSAANGGTSTYLNPHAIFWQAPIATAGTSGNMAEVGYFVRWNTSNPKNPRAILCRYFVNPGDANYLVYSQPSAWLTSSLLDTVAPGVASGTPSQNYAGWFADNVIGLWVRGLDGNGYPITITAGVFPADCKTTNYCFDSRLGYCVRPLIYTIGQLYLPKSAYCDSVHSSNVEHVLSTLPSTIEIAIVVIDAQTANYVTRVPDYTASYATGSTPLGYNAPAGTYATCKNSPSNFWNDINIFLNRLKTSQPRVAKGAHVYSIRVPMLNGG